MANGATSALRLHQRLPQVQFNRQFLSLFLMEDSAHYLFFSIIFIFAAPITLVLAPVVLFAVLHFASYSLTLLDMLGIVIVIIIDIIVIILTIVTIVTIVIIVIIAMIVIIVIILACNSCILRS